ncbi:MAG: alpha/beta hydrolase [Bacteroidales bacterium]|nr:alpha/beta hydrolase [Bacteroidales bacterium]
MPHCSVEQGLLFYEVKGKGSPLLLIAGLASDVQSWVTVKKSLSSHFQLIMVDNRGVGRTKFTSGTISIDQMTEDIICLLDCLGYDKVYVMGHSMGGMIAMNLAVKYPERVDKLVLTATTPKLNARNIYQLRDWVTFMKEGMNLEMWYKNLFYWIYSDAFFEKPGMLTAWLMGALNYQYPVIPDSFSEQVEAIVKFDFTEKLHQINCPTLALNAKHDRLFNAEESFHLFRTIKNIQFETLPEAGHALHVEQPEDFAKLVTKFLF